MNQETEKGYSTIRARIFKMVSVGVVDDRINQSYDVISTALLLLNLVCAFARTFEAIELQYGPLLDTMEQVTVAFFALDYILRVYTADFLYPDRSRVSAMLKYMTSGAGIIDLLSFLPYYLPMFFPAGAVAFRLIRVARILRLFRINAYYDSLNVISEVIIGKSQQLLSSVFIIFVLMLASSLAMYSIEHEAQPDVFRNAFSGIWWSVSTLLTVGYGDIYPVTPLGKFVGILITFLGVGMVAIPTGIISAGFVEQYSRVKRDSDYAHEQDLHFVKIELKPTDDWNGKAIRDLMLPKGILIAVIQRGREGIVPRGDVILKAGDRLVICAEPVKNDRPINLKEITLRKNHDWNGTAIRDLDISRKSNILMVKRDEKLIIPYGDLILRENDTVILYTKERISHEDLFPV